MVAKSYRLLRAILNTAVTEDELIIVNPCRIKGAGDERASERPVLTLEQLYALVDNEHGQPWHRGNFNPAVRWREAREQIGVP
jgi:hypothetical protein